MYAVIKTGGKQYKVAKDDVLKVEKIEADEGATVTFESVMMVGDGEAVTIGAPFVSGASVATEVVEHGRGRKIIIFKKSRRKHYRRRNGHRQPFTTLKVTDILTGGAEPKAAKAKKAAPKAEAPSEAAEAAANTEE